MRTNRRSGVAGIAGALLVGMFVSGCAADDPSNASADSDQSATSDGSTTPDGSATSDGSEPEANRIYEMLPDEVKEEGYLVVGTDPQFGPPTNFHPREDPQEWAGIEPDFLRVLEPTLGVEIRWEEVKFETLIPGVRSGRYDLGVNSLTDSVDRQAQVDMVDWLTGGNLLIVKKGNPDGIQEIADICGKPIAMVQGSTDIENLGIWSKENCEEDEQIEILTFKSRPDALLALRTDRVVTTPGGMGFSINLVHDFEGTGGNQADQYDIVDDLTYTPSGEPNYGGIAVQKGRPELVEALMAAIQKLMDDGDYDEILDKWHWPRDARLDEPLLNHATR